jgi:glutaredoxin
MKKYDIPLMWAQGGVLTVSAETLNDALETLANIDMSKLVLTGVTLPNSTKVVYQQLAKHVPDEYITDTIKLYISSKMPNCGYCQKAKEYFKKNNIEYETIDIANDSEARKYVRGRTGSLAVPQIEIGNELLRGFNLLEAERVLRKYSQ